MNVLSSMHIQDHWPGMVGNTFYRLHRTVKTCANKRMEIADLRRKNLRRLIAEKADGNATLFGSMVNRQQSYISDVLAGRKSFGEKVCRDIESRLGIDSGWLDRDQFEGPDRRKKSTDDQSINYTLLAEAMDIIRDYEARNRTDLTRTVLLAVFLYIRHQIERNRPILDDEIKHIIDMVHSYG